MAKDGSGKWNDDNSRKIILTCLDKGLHLFRCSVLTMFCDFQL